MRETMHKIGTETETRSFLAIVALAVLLSAALMFVAMPIAGAATPNGVTPFMIYGNVSYGNGTQCTNPDVGITNLNTGVEWQAETNASSNHYQIVLTSGTDLNATDVLRFNATDGTKTNVTYHTITADEVWAGGLFGFNLTLEPPVRVSIADTTTDLSDTVTLPIMITNIGNYGTGTIKLTYNPTVVHVTDVTGSSDSTVFAKNIDNAIGLVSISASNTNGASGSIVFANVTFTSVGVGSTPLNVTVDTLQDIYYQDIPSVTIDNGSITVPDTTSPTIAITSPTDGLTFRTPTITVSGTASDNVGLSKVEVKVGSGSWQTASGTTSWSKSVTLASGSNTIYARATDTSGNTKETLVTVTYTVPVVEDTTDPLLVVDQPTNGEDFAVDSITVSGTASDNVGLSKVEVKVGSGSWQTASGTTSWTTSVTLASGSNTIHARATDTSGNTKETSVTVTYTPPDATLPTISITYPTDGQTFTTHTITVNGTASDNVGLGKVEVKVGSGSWQTASGTTSWTTSVTLASGSNTIYARATDTSGNTKETSVTVTYTPPDATLPTISITYPTNGQTFTTPTITVNGTASDNVGLGKVEVKVGSGSWQTASGTTSWTASVTLASGSNTIYARATDTSGNPKETSVTVTYDRELTTADAVTVLQMAVRGEYSEDADVNGDSQVTSVDALMILQRLAIHGEQ